VLPVLKDQVEPPALKVLPVHPVGVVQQELQDPKGQVAHQVLKELQAQVGPAEPQELQVRKDPPEQVALKE